MTHDEQTSIDIFDFFEIIKARWKFLISFTLFFSLVFGAYIFTIPSKPQPIHYVRMESYAEIVNPYPTQIADFLKKRAQAAALLSPHTIDEIDIMRAPLEEVFFDHTTRETQSYTRQQAFLAESLDYYQALVSSHERTIPSASLLAVNSSVFNVNFPVGDKRTAVTVLIKYSTLVPGVAQKALARFLEYINSIVNKSINDSINIAIEAEIEILKSQLILMATQKNLIDPEVDRESNIGSREFLERKIKLLRDLRDVTPSGDAFSFRAIPAYEYPVEKPHTQTKTKLPRFLGVIISGVVGLMIACIIVLAQYSYRFRRRGNH